MSGQSGYTKAPEHQPTDVLSVEVSSNTKDVTYLRRFCLSIYKHRGVIFILLSASLFALWSAVAKLVTRTLAPMQLMAMSTPIATVGSAVLCVHRGVDLPRGRQCCLLLTLTSLMVTAKNMSHFFSLEYIPLADIISINQSSVIMVGILGCVFLKERFGVIEAVFSIMAILGVVVVARPSFIFGETEDPLPNYNPFLGVLLSLIFAITLSIFAIAMRKATLLGVHPYFNSTFNTGISMIASVSVCTALGQWQCPTRSEWLYVCVVGVTYFVGQLLYYVALSLETATTCTVLHTFIIVVGFIWQFVFFSILPTWTSACGAGLITAACVGTVVQNSRKSAPERMLEAGTDEFGDHPMD